MRRMGLFLSVLLISPCMPAHAACGAPGYSSLAVKHYITDNMLHRRWAVVANCSHPERPWTVQEAPWQPAAFHGSAAPDMHSPMPAIPMVKAGSKVEIWRMAETERVRLQGIAMDAGAEGQIVRVRLSQSTVVLEGRVRGAGSVELAAAHRWSPQ